jgi:3-oxosteroid 1-dehydrogenase
MDWDHETDVVVVGTGAAGLTAALVAQDSGLKPLVVEKTDMVGGSTAYSFGAMWIPDNPLKRAAGEHDSFEAAMTYLEDVVGDAGPASSRERKAAFLRSGPEAIAFLQAAGMRLIQAKGYPDYYPERPGGSVEGRGVAVDVFDGNRLGEWLPRLRANPVLPGLALHPHEVPSFALMMRTREGFLTSMKLLLGRNLGRRMLRQKPLGGGRSLAGQLLRLCLDRDVPIWMESGLTQLVVEDGRVTGVELVRGDGGRVRVGAARGVVLCAGGFAKDDALRQQNGPHPIGVDWTSAAPGDTGDAIRAGVEVGAATALMDDAWWGPSALVDGAPTFMLWERALPGSMIVDAQGERFMNEAASYVECGHRQYERNATVPAIPAWLVVDAKHRRRYPFGPLAPGMTPKKALQAGWIKRGETLEELARACGIDPAGLARTAARFAGFAASGRDEDFHRGDSAYDRYYGDPRVGPNPNLAPLDKGPFYATAIYPGDLGTKGGLLTDEHARVVRSDGTSIAGLYAAGNSAATVMGRTYPGTGGTLGPTIAFAYVAARHAAGEAA